MRKASGIVLLLFMLLPSLQVAAQQKAILNGKISHPTEEEDSVFVSLHRSYLDPREELIGAALDDKGHFHLEVPVTAAMPADLLYGNEVATIFLQPGTDLEVKFRGDDILKSLKFSGAGAAENNYLAKFTWEFDEDEAYQTLPYNITVREAEFTKFVDKRKQQQLKFFRKYNQNGAFSPAFQAYAQAEIEYTWAGDKLNYADLREQIVIAEDRIKLSEGYYGFVKQLDLQNEANMISPTFQQFLTDYAGHLAFEAGYRKSHRDYYKMGYELAKQELKGEARQLVLGRLVYQSIRNGNYGNTRNMLQDYAQLNPRPDYLRFLNAANSMSMLTSQLSLGAPAPAFTLSDQNGKSISLSDFRGKIVYLNFWSSSCGLCLMDAPHLKMLQEKLQGREVVFLNVSMDDDEATWRNTISSRKMSGINVLAKGKVAELMQLYNMTEKSGYFVIGEDGRLLNSNPKRPSNSEAYNELISVIEKRN